MSVDRVEIPVLAGIARRVKMAVEADTDGLRTYLQTITGTSSGGRDPFVKPNLDGTWPKQTRSTTAPGTLMWLRPITETTLAPMPTTADGFIAGVRGDLVFPLPEAGSTTPTTPPAGSMLFSDSFNVAASIDFSTRTGDTYAGGAAPTWQSQQFPADQPGRCRVLAGEGLNFYNNVMVRATAPSLPTTGTWRAAFTISAFDASHTAQILLRAPSYTDDTARTWLRLQNSGGVLVVDLRDTTDGTVTLGQAPLTVGQTRVVVEFDGAQVRVSVDGTQLTPGAVPTRFPRLANFAMRVPAWHFISLKNVTVESV